MRSFLFPAAAFSMLALQGCNATPDVPVADASRAALPTMERIARGANQCWFKSGDPAFKPYRMALELDSYSGKPRILLVKRNSPETRPLLVVQAEGNPAKLEAFGPMMGEGQSARISQNVNAWANGGSGC